MTKYLFIDGGYLDGVLRDVSREWHGGAAMTPNYHSMATQYQKVFYYDCLPARKEAETQADFVARRAAKEARFEQLRNIDGWHVSEGLAKHRRRTGAQQKEVDILIAVDILSHTHRKNMEEMSFLAGDQDFCPLIEAVVREGMYVNLWYHPLSISKDLKDAADASWKLDHYAVHSWMTPDFQRAYPLPKRWYGGPNLPNGIVREVGMRGGAVFAHLFMHAGGDQLEIVNASPFVPGGQQFHHLGPIRDLDVLKRAHEHMFGSLEWNAAR